jgi:hypothetical protein
MVQLFYGSLLNQRKELTIDNVLFLMSDNVVRSKLGIIQLFVYTLVCLDMYI